MGPIPMPLICPVVCRAYDFLTLRQAATTHTRGWLAAGLLLTFQMDSWNLRNSMK